MSWVGVGLVGGSALMGGINNRAKQKQERKNMDANATAIEVSPWTGMNPGMMPSSAPSTLGGALQGGLSGAMMASQFGKGTSAAAETPASSESMTQGAMDVGNATKPPTFTGGSSWDEMQKKKMGMPGSGYGTIS